MHFDSRPLEEGLGIGSSVKLGLAYIVIYLILKGNFVFK